jgi:hypothetical protein
MKQPFFVNENNCCANIIQSNEMSQGLITFGIWRQNVKVDAGTRWHPLAPAGTRWHHTCALAKYGYRVWIATKVANNVIAHLSLLL